MDQGKWEEIMEFLKANQQKMDANQEGMMARMEARMDSYQHEMKTQFGFLAAKMDANRRERKAHREEMRAKMDAWLGGVTHAYLEEEPAVEEPQDVHIGATDEEAIRATEDRAGEQRLAVRRHRQRKKRAQVNGGPRQKFAALFTRRAIPAMRKGHIRRGPGKRCHRNSVRRPGRTSGTRIVKRDWQPAVGYRSPLKPRTKVTVVQGAPEGRTDDKRRRTCSECNSGIWKLNRVSHTGKKGRTEKRRLERMETDREIIRRSLRLEIAKLMIESSVGLREPGNGKLWKCRPPPKRKR
jgi:hypothetical protein